VHVGIAVVVSTVLESVAAPTAALLLAAVVTVLP
jgi:hypothetical protein